MSIISYPILSPISYPVGGIFGLPIYGGVLLPPIPDELLVWLKGNSDDTEKLDSWKKPDAEDFTMSQSNCITLNGVDEYGTLDSVVTLSGDFEIFTECFVDTSAYFSPIGESSDNHILANIGSINRIKIDGVNYTFTVPAVASFTSLRYSRVGSEITFTVNGEHTDTISCSTTDFPVLFLGQQKLGVDNLEGKLYNLRLQDSTQDIHFRIAEGNSSEFSWDDTGTNYITWTGVLADMWAGRQDSYHGNAVDGWWEKAADATMYPYAVAGFLEYHKGGTWNDCETSYRPEEFPVGTFNGVDDHIILTTPIVSSGDFSISGYMGLTANGSNQFLLRNTAGDSYMYLVSAGTWTVKIQGTNYNFANVSTIDGRFELARVGTTLTLTVGSDTQSVISNELDFDVKTIGRDAFPILGIIRDVNINGILIPINEGTGTDIHDSDGNLVGTISGDETFWEGEPMVAQAIGDMEAAAGINYFTDGKYHALPMTQQAWGELGAELIENGEFIYGEDSWVLDTGWTISNGKATSDGTDDDIEQLGGVEVGKTYKFSFDILEETSGRLLLYVGGTYFGTTISGVGTHTGEITATNTNVFRLRGNSVFIGSIDNISVREVNQAMDNNLQYWFCPTAGLILYKNPLTVPEAAEVEYFLYKKGCFEYEVLIDAVSGEVLYDEISGKLIFDEEA